MKPRSGSASLAETKLVLPGRQAREVVPGLGRFFADRLQAWRVIQAVEMAFSDRNQLAALTLHGLILPCASDKTGGLFPSGAAMIREGYIVDASALSRKT